MPDGPTSKMESKYIKVADDLLNREQFRFDRAHSEVQQHIVDKLEGKPGLKEEDVKKLYQEQKDSVTKQQDIVSAKSNWTISGVTSPQDADNN